MGNAENSNRTTSVTERVCRTVFHILDNRENFHVRKNEEKLLSGESCTYSLSLSTLPDRTILIDEQITPHDRDLYTHRHWFFSKEEDSWKLSNADKNSLAVAADIVDLELLDLLDRLEGVLHNSDTRFEIPVPVYSGGTGGFTAVMHRLSSRAFTLAAAGLILAGLFLTAFISTLQYGRMLKTVYTLNDSIQYSANLSTSSLEELTGELARVSTELDSLKTEVFQEREAFLFNRKQTAMNLRWLASQFPRSSYSRKKAYLFLADRVDEAGTYGEMVYQLSRLPENNAQAETLIATDRDNDLSMNNFNPVFSGMILPVDTGRGNDNKANFMISSGYIERRLSPLGYGGVKPHHAVDIINLDNIIRISRQNDIIRDESHSGHIISSFSGIVLDDGFDYVYGWHVEIRHELTPEIHSTYPAASFWTTFYAHMKDPVVQNLGQRVMQGEKLGEIGNSGRSTGPHLHFEVRIYHSGGGEPSPFGNFNKINPYREVSSQTE